MQYVGGIRYLYTLESKVCTALLLAGSSGPHASRSHAYFNPPPLQINQVGDQLRADDFLMNKKVALVAHSPLLRARQTSEGMLGCVTGNSTSEQKLSPPVQRVEELTCLLEKTPSEWIPGNFGGFAKRIVEFEQWVCDQPEDSIAIVGHSQFFKAMLEMSYKFDNCDVWEITLDCTKVPGRNDGEQEEKKDDTAVVVEKKNVAEADCSAQGDEVPLPRGWMGLKKLYRYDRTEKSEEDTSSE